MKKCLSIVAVLVTFLSSSALANSEQFDYDNFVKQYYRAMTNTQLPNASNEDLEFYLSFLTDDVGNQHLPNAPDDSRAPTVKL